MSRKINIGMADDHVVLRQGLKALLNEYEDIKVKIDVSNGRELLEELKTCKIDVLLLDIEMPIMDGRETLDKLKVKYPKLKVIIMSMHFNDSYIIEFIRNGACGFLPKNCDIEKIVDAIYSVHEKGFYSDTKVSTVMAKMIQRIPTGEMLSIEAELLTEREIEVLKLICSQKTNAEIADILSKSIRTIEGHRLNICKKTNTNNVMDLIAFAKKNSLI